MTYNFLHYDATDHNGERKEFASLTDAILYGMTLCSTGYARMHLWRDDRLMATVNRNVIEWLSEQANWELCEEREADSIADANCRAALGDYE